MNFRGLWAFGFVLASACGSSPPQDSATDDGRDSAIAALPGPSQADVASDDPIAVLQAYYDAIGSGDYQRAYLLWGDSGRSSGQTSEEFRVGFRNTSSVEARIGAAGRLEGAAGSRYVEVPIEIQARTTTGEVQHFAGTYTLRRVVIDGATDVQRRWHLDNARIAACAERCEAAGSDSTQVAEVVRRLGERLRLVSVLGPRESVTTSIRENYGPLVTANLLARWTANPSEAPGRTTSNPWPRGIRVTRLEPNGDRRWDVTGAIDYVTTADTTTVVESQPSTLRLTRSEIDSWRISSFDR